MRGLRQVFRFCRAKLYISRFDTLENEVNRMEIQTLEKEQELKKIQKITQLSNMQYIFKSIMKLANQPYEYRALTEERQSIKELQQQFKQLSELGEQRANVMKKLKKEEQEAVETVFLTDLAKFCLKYESLTAQKSMDQDIQTGIELSHKSLEKVLEKEKVEWIGNKGDKFDPDYHTIVEGKSSIIKKVISRGFKIKDKVIEKAKVK